MKPGEHISVMTNVGKIEGTLKGWDVNGLKISVYDSYTAWIKWYHIYNLNVS